MINPSTIIVAGTLYFVLLATAALVALGLGRKHDIRSTNKIVDDFLKYAKKGRRKVPIYGLAFGWLAFIIIFPFQIFWFLGWAITGNVIIGLLTSITLCFLLFRQIALSKDKIKKSRHNGLALGYEYTHPAGKEGIHAGAEGEELKRIAYGGSKGTYEISLLSEPSPHAMIVGKSGEGKSTTMRTILSRAYSKYEMPFLIIDWSGEYRKLGEIANLWVVPKSLKVNPLLLRGMPGVRRSGIAAETLQFSLNLTNLQTQKVRDLLMEMYDSGASPTMQMLYFKVMESIEKERFKDIKVQNQYIANKLRQTFEVFGNEPEEFWKNYSKACNVIELEGLTTAEKSLVTYSLLQRIIEEFKGERKTSLIIALDDAYEAVRSQYGIETPITKIVREGRKYGFGLMISTQMLADIPDAVIANTSVKIVHPNQGPEDVQRIQKMMHLSEIEKEIMRRMPIGFCFVLDDNLLQGGRSHSAYVEVDGINYKKIEQLLSKNPKLEIKDAKDVNRMQISGDGFALLKRYGLDMPSVTIYRFIIALSRSSNLQSAYQYLRQKKWITSDTTIYGTKGKPSLRERASEKGYFDASDKLTEKALEIIDPDRLIARQGVLAGNEEHKDLMKKTIASIQESGSFAFVLKEQDAFDVGEIGVDQKARGLWNYKDIRAYECQERATEEDANRCEENARKFGAKLIFVAGNEKVNEELKRITKNRYEYIVM